MKPGCRSVEAGFTSLELLVVLVVMLLLMGVFWPSMARFRTQNKSAVCLNNLRQVGVGMHLYAAENDGNLFSSYGFFPNGGKWTSNPRSSTVLAPAAGEAYWGIAYVGMVGSREVFRCPSARIVDEWRDAGFNYPSEFWLTSTYGLSSVAFDRRVPTPRLTELPNPSTTILVQDAAEQKMEGPNDTLGLFPGYVELLTQWKALSATVYDNYPFEWEWYRHDQRCNTLWSSGHVTKIPFTGLDVGIDYRYYTGEAPVVPLP